MNSFLSRLSAPFEKVISLLGLCNKIGQTVTWHENRHFLRRSRNIRIDKNGSQWFPARENKVANMLSWDFTLDNKQITKLIRLHGSPLVPQAFRITPLQPTLISQIGGWLRRLPRRQLLPTQPAPSATQLALLRTFPWTSRNHPRSFSPQVRTNWKNRSPRLFCCRPSGRTASLQITYDSWPWTHVWYHLCSPQQCGSDLPAKQIWEPDPRRCRATRPPSSCSVEETRRRRPWPNTPASRPVGSNSYGAIADEKQDGRQDRPARGRRILLRDVVMRIFRRGQWKAVITSQDGRRPFPEERRDNDDYRPRSPARGRHGYYHVVQEAEEQRQRSDGDTTSKLQLGTI